MLGSIDGVMAPDTCFGWALDPADPRAGAPLQARLRGVLVAASFERRQRPDLRDCQPNLAGFVARLGSPVPLLDWLAGAVTLHAGAHALPLGRSAVRDLALLYGAELQAELDGPELARYLETIAGQSRLAPESRLVLRGAAKAIADPAARLATDQGSMVAVPVGTRSLDGVAMIAHGGHALLVGGTNNVLAQYGPEETAGEDDAVCAAWLALFRARAAQARAGGHAYLQVIVPEKLSVMPELYTQPIRTPTRALRALEARIADDPALRGHYLPVHALFAAAPDRPGLFPPIDTHLSESGCYRLFCAMLDRLGLERPQEPSFTMADDTEPGDLAERFSHIPLLNRRCVVGHLDPRLGEAGLQLIESSDPPEADRHNGMRRRWHNAGGISALRVMAFGNSFFERGGEPKKLSWWFARYFRDFAFVWGPDHDADGVAAFRPDIVVCQTIERFLPTVPAR